MTAFLIVDATTAEAAEKKSEGAPERSATKIINESPPAEMAQWQLPNAAAAAALGEGDGLASSPATMRQLDLQILTRGEATGFTIESSPYLIDNILSFDDYQSDYWIRALARIQVSGALLDEQNGPAKAALGVKWTAFNESDPYYDTKLYNAKAARALRGKVNPTDDEIRATGCLGELLLGAELGTPLETPPIDGAAPDKPKFHPREDLEKGRRECLERAQSRNDWNTTGLDISVVQLWSSYDKESVADLAPAGVVVNANLGYGLFGDIKAENDAPKGQVILTTRLGYNVVADTKAGSTARRDEKALALRGRYGTRRFNASVEAAYSENDYAAAPDQSQWTYTLAAEYQISDGFWLVASIADQSGDSVAGDDTKATATFRWALADKASLKVPEE